MTADRFLFSAVLAACAAVTLLSFAEPARVAQAQLPTTATATAPVVQLERVVITASREQAPSHLASATAVAIDATTVTR